MKVYKVAEETDQIEIEELRNSILNGHVLQALKLIPSGTVDLIITSPPYWGLRDYKTKLTIWDETGECEHKFTKDKLERFTSKENLNHKKSLHNWNKDGQDRKFGGKTKAALEKHNWQEYMRDKNTWGKPNDGGGKLSTKGSNNFQFIEPKTFAFCENCNAWLGQLGLEPTFDLYLKHLFQIMEECWRVLKPTGALYVNLGDTYFGGGQASGHSEEQRDGMGNKTIGRGQVFKPVTRAKQESNVKKKSLCGIPARFQIGMIERGWVNRNKPIWHKPNGLPASVKDRFTNNYEEIFYFTKQGKYYFELQFEDAGELDRWGGNKIILPDTSKFAELDETDKKLISNRTGREMEARPYGNKRIMRTVWEFLLELELPEEILNELHFVKGDKWKIPVAFYEGGHFAVYPEELVETPIKANCPSKVCITCSKPHNPIIERIPIDNPEEIEVYEGQAKKDYESHKAQNPSDSKRRILESMKSTPKITGYEPTCKCDSGTQAGVVMDIFFGRGTVGKVARSLGRDFIGIELNEEYVDLAKKYIGVLNKRLEDFMNV